MTEAQEKAQSVLDAGAVHQAVDDAVARERSRMARELHDGLATDLAAAISRIGRQTQGVIVMRLTPDDQVVAIAPVASIEEGDSRE